ncbi:LMBR1-like conserved region-containing protein [Trypanosoma rangeli]|uniref:LMBR1-like conserved region-containing protein n=1 Tax=Trypanosoma rangeli TaxID=5698 RepID=A0A3R7MFA3_TRYRA|nr:LMBR1-like conserved region-containing protein [Trypanosoma rangeli]RNF01457.1 LMBR1-like conserved region-containing protein [Trypanosoma rangeli]|eukprot:RNF01457.1 LMBR1-like conserved region-containing protein [Trypanosoma rangeli]
MDKVVVSFGAVTHGCFLCYLLSCVVKGCIKIGGNLLLFHVYPMLPGSMLMNAFLFNAMLIMVTSTPFVEFCIICFADYAVNTNVCAMFTFYMTNMQGLKYIVMHWQYPLLVIASVSFVWLLLCLRRRVDGE